MHTWRTMELAERVLDSEGEHVGAVVGFKTKKGEAVHVKVASSFISPEQAELKSGKRNWGGVI